MENVGKDGHGKVCASEASAVILAKSGKAGVDAGPAIV